MVGLADLKKHIENVRKCRMTLNNKYCYFQLTGLTIYDFLDILNFKSWLYKAYQKSVTMRYVNVLKDLKNGNATFRTSVGFAPLLLRFLKGKGFQILDQDIEVFRARNVVFPDLKINLYDFQDRMINNWLKAGCIGVVKSPTGSGKTIIGCGAIKNTGRKTLILVHTSDLLINVWNESLIKSFGPGIMGQVGIVGGGLSDDDRMAMQVGVRSGDFHENMKKDIVIATFQTFVNHLDELSNYKFGLIIVDEVHHVPSQMFRKVSSTIRAPFKMGLSATVRRLDGMEKDVFGQMGDIQSSVTIRELINKGLLAEPRFQSPVIVDRQVIEEIDTCGHAGLAFSRFVKKASASSIKKKNYIVNVCKNVATRGRKFLLFTDYVNAEDVFVRDLYADSLLKEDVNVAIIDQEMSTEERSTVFKYLERGDISGIVFGKLGSEGVNIPSVDVVVMANAIKCVAGDTLIPTDRGIIRAEDLNNIKPTTVSTLCLENRSIVKANINELFNFEQEETITIRTEHGYEIEGSLSHMILVKDAKNNIIFKPLSDVNIGDITLITNSDLYGEDIDIDYDMLNPRKNRSNTVLGKYVIEIIDRINNSNLIDKNKEKYIKIDHDELVSIANKKIDIDPYLLSRRIKYMFSYRGLSSPIPRFDSVKHKWYYIVKTMNKKYRRGYIDSEIFIPNRMNVELAELLGYFVSEGYVSTKIEDWRATFSNSDEFLIDRVIYLFKFLFNYDINIYNYKSGNTLLQCTRKNIVRFLATLELEHLAPDKFVPNCILRSSKNTQVAFLGALFSGDGSACKDGRISYTSTSKRLCKEVHMMLLNMGIISKYDHYENSIFIYSYEVDNFMDTIGFLDGRKVYIPNFRRDTYLDSKIYLGEKGENVVLFDNIVYKSKGKSKLYDMNVDVYHSFIAGGFVNHNSPITFTQRVGRVMRKTPGKDFCDVYEVLLDTKTEYRWSDFNFAEYKMEGFQKLVYKVE